MDEMRVAILDLGTNTFNLILAKVTSQSYHIYYSEKIATKIGKGGISKGIISRSARDRALTALNIYKAKINEENITQVFGFATSAFRNAINGPAFRDEIKEKTGITINIITGDLEAGYIYEGVKNALYIGSSPSLIMDIGGGSVEFIIANQEKIFWKRSFEIGAQRLLDKFHMIDPIPAEEILKLNAYFAKQLQELETAIAEYKPVDIIGSSGTFDTLSEIYCIDHKIDIDESMSELPLTLPAYQNIHNNIIVMHREDRMKIPGMIAMRVDMIVVASCLIQFVLSLGHFKHIRVSSFSLKEGIINHIREEYFPLPKIQTA